MAKDAYWFRHDSTSGRGLRMRKMQHIHGHWGKGIYWDIIETLREQNEYKYESNEQSLQMLCDLISCKDVAKFMSWYRDCVKFELFKEEGGHFFSEVLSENMKKWEKQKDNGSKSKGNKKPKHSQSIANGIGKVKPNHNIREEKRIEDKTFTEKKLPPDELFQQYSDWVAQILNETDPEFEKLLYKDKTSLNPKGIEDFLACCARYENWKFPSQQAFRIGAMNHMKTFGNGKLNNSAVSIETGKQSQFQSPKK